MTSTTVTMKSMTVLTQCNETSEQCKFNAFKLRNGVILIKKHEFLGTAFTLQKLEGAKIISIEETNEQIEFSEEEFKALFHDSRKSKFYTISSKSSYSELAARMNPR